MPKIFVTSHNLSSRVDVIGAFDANVTVTFEDDRTISGTVSLVPREPDGVLEPRGGKSEWVSDSFQRAFYDGLISRSTVQEIVEAVRAAVVGVAP